MLTKQIYIKIVYEIRIWFAKGHEFCLNLSALPIIYGGFYG